MHTSLSRFIAVTSMLTLAFGPLGDAHAVARQPIASIQHEYGRMYNVAEMPLLFSSQRGGNPARWDASQDWKRTGKQESTQIGYDVHGNLLKIEEQVEMDRNNGYRPTKIKETVSIRQPDGSWKELKRVDTNPVAGTRDITFPPSEPRADGTTVKVVTKQKRRGGDYVTDVRVVTQSDAEGTEFIHRYNAEGELAPDPALGGAAAGDPEDGGPSDGADGREGDPDDEGASAGGAEDGRDRPPLLTVDPHSDERDEERASPEDEETEERHTPDPDDSNDGEDSLAGDPLLKDFRQYPQGPEGNWTCEWRNVGGKVQRGVAVVRRPWTWKTVGDATQGHRWYQVRKQDGQPELKVLASFLDRNGNWTDGFAGTWVGGRPADHTSLNRIGWGYYMLGHWGGKSELQQSGRNQIRGRWSYGENEGGTEVWKRAQPRITRVVFKCDGKSDTAPRGTTGRVEYSYEKLRSRDSYTMPGNRPKFTIEIYGDNLWGLHVYDLAGALDLSPLSYGYLNRDGNSCSNHPGRVAGVSIGVMIWHKVKPGRKTLRLDGLTIPFDFVLNGYPTESISDSTESSSDGNAPAETAEDPLPTGVTSPLAAAQQDVKDATSRFRGAAERYKEDRSAENLEQLQEASAALQEAWQNLLEQMQSMSPRETPVGDATPDASGEQPRDPVSAPDDGPADPPETSEPVGTGTGERTVDSATESAPDTEPEITDDDAPAPDTVEEETPETLRERFLAKLNEFREAARRCEDDPSPQNVQHVRAAWRALGPASQEPSSIPPDDSYFILFARYDRLVYENILDRFGRDQRQLIDNALQDREVDLTLPWPRSKPNKPSEQYVPGWGRVSYSRWIQTPRWAPRLPPVDSVVEEIDEALVP